MKPRNTMPVSFLFPAWLRAPAVSIGAGKEFREILPYWLVAMVTSLVWVVGWPMAWEGQGMAWSFYLVGELAVVAMGAASFGHEFTHLTMLLALSQPRARTEVWRQKMQVLALAMLTIWVVRLAGPLLHGNSVEVVGLAGLMSVSALAYGLLVAPLFALWSRSTLAATVFTVALPLVTWQAASLVAALQYGMPDLESAVAQQAVAGMFLVAMLAQWLAGPVLAYYAFRRLEATDSRGPAIRLPRFVVRAASGASATSGAPRRRHSVWSALVWKELRLLTPAYVVAGLYLLLVLSDSVLRRSAWENQVIVETSSTLAGVATLIYAVLVSLLIGSLACAEDRHTGTLPWHLVQPVAGWFQWLVKAGVALAMALVLALGLPLLVLGAGQARSLAGSLGVPPPLGYGLVAVHVLALCTLSLYLSTLTASAMRAMLWAAPIGLTVETLVTGLLDSTEVRSALWNWLVPFETEGRSLLSPAGVVWVLFCGLVAAGALLTPLACAFRNFRSLDQGASRVVTHVGLMVGYVLLACAAWFSFRGVMHAAGASLPMRALTLAERQAASCDANVSEIANAVAQWALAHDHQVPSTLAQLTNELASPQVLVCPADTSRQPATDWIAWKPAQVSYGYEPLAKVDSPAWTAELRCPVHETAAVVGTVLARYGLSSDDAHPGQAPGVGTQTNDAHRPEVNLLRRYGLVPYPQRPPYPRQPSETNEIAPPPVP